MTPLIVIIFAAISLLVAAAAFLTLQEARTREVYARIDRAVGNQGEKDFKRSGVSPIFGRMVAALLHDKQSRKNP